MDAKTAAKRFYQTNLGFTDREVRMLAGAGMIAAVIFYAPTPIGLWGLLALAAIPIIATSIMGWDPLYALLGFTTYHRNESDIHQRTWFASNIGTVDRYVRVGLAGILIGSMIFGPLVSWELAGAMAAILLVASAMMAWDPLYALAGLNTFASKKDVALVNSETENATLGKLYTFPKQARKTRSGEFAKAA